MELLHEILGKLNNDQNLDSTNVVEKIKQEFERKKSGLYEKWDSCQYEYELCKKEYDAWQEGGFSLDHQFDTVIITCSC